MYNSIIPVPLDFLMWEKVNMIIQKTRLHLLFYKKNIMDLRIVILVPINMILLTIKH